jgi:hypothetical protein
MAMVSVIAFVIGRRRMQVRRNIAPPNWQALRKIWHGQTVDQIESDQDSREIAPTLTSWGRRGNRRSTGGIPFQSGTILAVAFGGGLILANVVGGSRSRDESSQGAGPVNFSADTRRRALAGVG